MSDFFWMLLSISMFIFGILLGDIAGRSSERVRILQDIKEKIFEKGKGSCTLHDELDLLMSIITSEKNS